jgi:hypothetical protein
MSLTDVNINAVKLLCEQVLRLASEAQDELASNPTARVCGSRTTGELRRRSMDLTRALADLRKP